MMTFEEYKTYCDDVLSQEDYEIFQDGEYVGIIHGHDAEHASHKMAQYCELDLQSLTASPLEK